MTTEKPVPGAVQHSHPVQGGASRTRTIGPKGLQIVENMAAEGHPDVAIAKALRMHQGTFRHCRRRQPEVQEALDRGRGALEAELAHLLLQHARNGNVVAAIFLAKARCGWREGDAPDAARPNITINLPDSSTPAKYLEMVHARYRVEEGDGDGG